MIAYSHEYSTRYYPPAPVAEIMVRDVERKEPEVCVIGMLDYGSDVTMIPIDVLEAGGTCGRNLSKNVKYAAFLDLAIPLIRIS
jgi:hypothetical protein